MPQISILVIALTLFVGSCDTAFAQNSGRKAQDLINALGKTKYKKKEKRNVLVEIYIDIKSEAVVKNNIQDYAGVYQSEHADYRIELRVSSDGKVEGNGSDFDSNKSQRRDFTLKNARIEDALLTATKVYADGKTELLEAVFNNRFIITGNNPNEINSRETKYGLGFIDSSEGNNGISTSRIFLEFKP